MRSCCELDAHGHYGNQIFAGRKFELPADLANPSIFLPFSVVAPQKIAANYYSVGGTRLELVTSSL